MRIRRKLINVGVSLVALAGLAGGGAYGYFRYRYGQIPKIHGTAVSPIGAGSPIDILIAGTDSRQGLTAAEQKLYGNTAVAGGNRSDATMILRVIPTSGRISLLSIPYDTFVPIYGATGPNKISDALNFGPKALVKTVEDSIHVPINAYIGVNFNGVVQLVQSLGGIKVDFPYPSKDTMSGLNVGAGCHALNGIQALALARSRFFYYYKGGHWLYDGSSGFGRIHRQHTVIRAMINKAKSSIVTNPLALNAFIGTAAKNVEINSKLSLGQLVRLAMDFRSFSGSNLTTYTYPTQIVNNYGNYGDVLFPVKSLDAGVVAKFLSQGSTTAAPTSGVGTAGATPPSSQPSSSSLPPAIMGSIVQNRTRPGFDPVPC